MNAQGFLILLIPILGLAAICRGGRWRWDVISFGGTSIVQSAFIHRLLLGMFWFGWSASLLIGLLMILDV